MTPQPGQADKIKPFSQWKARDTGAVVTVFCIAKDPNPTRPIDVVVYADFAGDGQQFYLHTPVFLQNFEFAEQIRAQEEPCGK